MTAGGCFDAATAAVADRFPESPVATERLARLGAPPADGAAWLAVAPGDTVPS